MSYWSSGWRTRRATGQYRHRNRESRTLLNRLLIPGVLLVLFALVINWMTDESGRLPAQEPGNEPDIYMLNASIQQYDSAGDLQHRIEADRFTHFPLTDVTSLIAPSIRLGSAARHPWTIDAHQGRILPVPA